MKNIYVNEKFMGNFLVFFEHIWNIRSSGHFHGHPRSDFLQSKIGDLNVDSESILRFFLRPLERQKGD